MNAAQTLKRLAALGSAQTRKVYANQGIQGELFGVRYADLAQLQKEIGTDHALAQALWKSGNHDARVLATMIADPERVSAPELESWGKDVDNHPLADALAKLASRSRAARKVMTRWMSSKGEWTCAAGWAVLSRLIIDPDEFTEADFQGHLRTIEKTIHQSPNRVRYAMNGALIAIGVSSESLREKALAAAKRIGPVEVDHGLTGCQTPDAADYIQKVLAYRNKKSAKARSHKSRAAARS